MRSRRGPHCICMCVCVCVCATETKRKVNYTNYLNDLLFSPRFINLFFKTKKIKLKVSRFGVADNNFDEIRNFNQLIYEAPKNMQILYIGEEFLFGGNYTGDILGHLTAVGQFQGNCITSQSGLGWLAGLGEPPKHWRGESGCVMSHLSGRGEIFDADNEISFSVAVPQVKTGPANPFWHQIDLSIVSPVASQRIIDAFFFYLFHFSKPRSPVFLIFRRLWRRGLSARFGHRIFSCESRPLHATTCRISAHFVQLMGRCHFSKSAILPCGHLSVESVKSIKQPKADILIGTKYAAVSAE